MDVDKERKEQGIASVSIPNHLPLWGFIGVMGLAISGVAAMAVIPEQVTEQAPPETLISSELSSNRDAFFEIDNEIDLPQLEDTVAISKDVSDYEDVKFDGFILDLPPDWNYREEMIYDDSKLEELGLTSASAEKIIFSKSGHDLTITRGIFTGGRGTSCDLVDGRSGFLANSQLELGYGNTGSESELNQLGTYIFCEEGKAITRFGLVTFSTEGIQSRAILAEAITILKSIRSI